MLRLFIIILILLIVLFFIKKSQEKEHFISINSSKENFVPIGTRGQLLNPFTEPTREKFVPPKTSPPPKPKCCPTTIKPLPPPKPTCPPINKECPQPEPQCCPEKEVTCPPCPKMDCPPCPKLTCQPCKPCEPVCPSKCPDLSRYVLKSSIPPCPPMPNMDDYILKSRIPPCPRMPDMSKYVLKSSIPPPVKCQPCPACICPPPPQIKVCDKMIKKKDCGPCPPCPRIKCPKPKLECKQVNIDKKVKFYTEEEIEEIVQKRLINYNNTNTENNSCIPKPYDSNEFNSPLLNVNLTGKKLI